MVLHIHHHDEDEVVFPWVHTKAPGMLDQQAAEHKELEAELDRMKEATKAGNVALIGEICTRVQTFLLPHLMQEQTKVTVEWLRANFTNAEIKRHLKELMASIKAAAPPEESFPWVVYHLKVTPVGEATPPQQRCEQLCASAVMPWCTSTPSLCREPLLFRDVMASSRHDAAGNSRRPRATRIRPEDAVPQVGGGARCSLGLCSVHHAAWRQVHVCLSGRGRHPSRSVNVRTTSVACGTCPVTMTMATASAMAPYVRVATAQRTFTLRTAIV